jgi:hypothetical protein
VCAEELKEISQPGRLFGVTAVGLTTREVWSAPRVRVVGLRLELRGETVLDRRVQKLP